MNVEYTVSEEDVRIMAQMAIARMPLDEPIEGGAHPTVLVPVVCEYKGFILTCENHGTLKTIANRIRKYLLEEYCPSQEIIYDMFGLAEDPFRIIKQEARSNGWNRGRVIDSVQNRMPALRKHLPKYGRMMERNLLQKEAIWGNEADEIAEQIERLRQSVA